MNTERSNANVILHIGAGSFHRAHQAWYLHRVNLTRKPDEAAWSLTVGNIRSDMNAVMDALAAQNGAYTLETVTPQGERASCRRHADSRSSSRWMCPPSQAAMPGVSRRTKIAGCCDSVTTRNAPRPCRHRSA